MTGASGGRALRALAPLLVAATLLLGFYAWTASAGRPFGFGEPHDRAYNLLARALLLGQLHLDVDPDPRLFELQEPYHPGRNAPFRLHDASLYRGRYYLYFGVVPAVVAFVPWRLAGLGDLPEPAAAVGFSLLGLVLSALLLRQLLRRHLEPPPGPVGELAAVVVLGVSSVIPFVLRSSHVYEVAIAAGYAFSAGAAWLFAAAGAGEKTSLKRLTLGGLLLGLAVGCRPNLVLIVPVLPLLALSRGRPRSTATAVRGALAVLAPLAVCGLLLGAYNLARFGSWTEFGTRYQLVGVPPVAQLEPGAVVPALYYAFLAPPALRPDFPFVFPDHDWSGPLPEGFFLDSSTTGALAHSPFLLILLALPWILREAPVKEPAALRRQLLVLVAAGLVVPAATAFAFASVAMRFQADYVHFLAVAALVLWFVLARRVRWKRGLFRTLVAVVFGWSVVSMTAISLTGVDPLRHSNPELFAALERRAEPLRRLAGILAGEERVIQRLRVAFPEELATRREPFLSWGRVEAYDVLWVRALSPGVFAFSLETHAATDPNSPARPPSPGVGFVPGRFYDVEVEIDRVMRRVSVRVEGEPRASFEGHLAAVSSRSTWPGRGPRGSGARSIGRFSGTLITEDMRLAGPPGLETLPPLSGEAVILTPSRTPPPTRGDPGRLWAVAGHKGAWVSTGEEWRWLPVGTLPAVSLELPAGDLPPPPDEEGIVPLLASGEGDVLDAVVLRRTRAGSTAVALARWSGTWELGATSPGLELTGAPARRLRVLLDRRDRQAVVWLDGREVLRAEADVSPLRPEKLRVGPRARRAAP